MMVCICNYSKFSDIKGRIHTKYWKLPWITARSYQVIKLMLFYLHTHSILSLDISDKWVNLWLFLLSCLYCKKRIMGVRSWWLARWLYVIDLLFEVIQHYLYSQCNTPTLYKSFVCWLFIYNYYIKYWREEAKLGEKGIYIDKCTLYLDQ